MMTPLITGLGLLATFWGITWKMSQDTDKKVGRMFKRFDEYKKNLEGTHVRREVCDLHVEQMSDNIAEIKDDIKHLLRIANGKAK